MLASSPSSGALPLEDPTSRRLLAPVLDKAGEDCSDPNTHPKDPEGSRSTHEGALEGFITHIESHFSMLLPAMVMRPVSLIAAFAALAGNAPFSAAQSTTSAAGACPTVLTPSYQAPVVGSGWTAQLIATGLTKPRSLTFDRNGALLAVQQGSGILRMTLTDNGGTCLVVNDTTTVVENSDVGVSHFGITGNFTLLINLPLQLNHAVQLSADGRTLYASTSNDVFRWSYDAAAGTVGDNETLVTNMSNTDVSWSCAFLSING